MLFFKNLFLVGFLFLMSANTLWAAQSFALVELFASEGCSSCPPADKVLQEITEQAANGSRRVYTLSFQVDYWNNLGWSDPFSNVQFSQRQYQYANILKTSVYTPQMIINGQESFVGSDRALAQKYIDHSLKTSVANDFSIKIENKNTQRVDLSYTTSVWDRNVMVNFALVEDITQSQVLAGENQGRLLTHSHIVRELKSEISGQKGQISFNLPSAKGNGHFLVIAFLQNKLNKEVLAAESLDLNI